MFTKHLSSHWVVVALLGLVACGGTADAPQGGGGTAGSAVHNTGGAGNAGQQQPQQQDASAAGQTDARSDATSGMQPSDSGPSNDESSNGSGSDAKMASSEASATTLYSCTFNATGMYPLGGEHKGYVIFGTVIDTTAGANRARVGDFQNALDTDNQIKFVWPGILTATRTYEIALFEDHAKDRTCSGAPGGAEAQWLFPVPAVTGDFTFNFTHNPRVASCQDFPAGPVP